MSDYLVMTAAEEGGLWRAGTLFHNIDDARDHLAHFAEMAEQQLAGTPRCAAIYPVVIDWDQQIAAYYTKEPPA